MFPQISLSDVSMISCHIFATVSDQKLKCQPKSATQMFKARVSILALDVESQNYDLELHILSLV